MRRLLIKNMFPVARSGKKGQSTVEFALMLPFLLVTMVGLAGFSLLFYSYVTAELGVREAASSAIRNPLQTADAVRTTACNAGINLVKSDMYVRVEPPDASNAQISCSSPAIGTGTPSAWVTGAPVAVTIVYTVPIPTISFWLNGNSIVLLAPVTISAQSKMTIE